jgi:hypothetical protein
MRRARLVALVFRTTLLLVVPGAAAWTVTAASSRQQRAAPHGWRTFEATWSAAGERHTLTVEDGRTAVIARLSGALVLKTGEGLSRGFRAQAIGFDDGQGAGVGRAVWTDDRGDQVFSDLTGHPAQTGRHVSGSITGGTGRYAGLTGSYTLTWDYVLPSDDGRIQARAAAVTGRFRPGDGQ